MEYCERCLELLQRLSEAEARSAELEAELELVGRQAALSREMLVAGRRLALMQADQRAHGMNMGGAFYERVHAQQAYTDVHDRAASLFGDDAELIQRYVHVDDVVNALETNSECAALAHSWPGIQGLRRVAGAIRAGRIRLGAPLGEPPSIRYRKK